VEPYRTKRLKIAVKDLDYFARPFVGSGVHEPVPYTTAQLNHYCSLWEINNPEIVYESIKQFRLYDMELKW
jgi:hypothetical protein